MQMWNSADASGLLGSYQDASMPSNILVTGKVDFTKNIGNDIIVGFKADGVLGVDLDPLNDGIQFGQDFGFLVSAKASPTIKVKELFTVDLSGTSSDIRAGVYVKVSLPTVPVPLCTIGDPECYTEWALAWWLPFCTCDQLVNYVALLHVLCMASVFVYCAVYVYPPLCMNVCIPNLCMA
jgi:hypothetical protein